MHRHVVSIVSIIAAAALIGLILFLYGGTAALSRSGNISTNRTVPFLEFAHGTETAVSQQVNYYITSTKELESLWNSLSATGTPPVIDFNKQSVLAVFAGSGAATAIAVTNIEDSDKRIVSITTTASQGTCAKKTESAPYEMVIMPNTTLPLAHVNETKMVPCAK